MCMFLYAHMKGNSMTYLYFHAILTKTDCMYEVRTLLLQSFQGAGRLLHTAQAFFGSSQLHFVLFARDLLQEVAVTFQVH